MSDKSIEQVKQELEQAKSEIEYLQCQIISAKELLGETMNNCVTFKSNVIMLSKNTQKLHIEIANLKSELSDLKTKSINSQES